MVDQTVKKGLLMRLFCEKKEAEFLKAQSINQAYDFQQEFC